MASLNGFKYYFAIISKTEEITLDWWDKMKNKIKNFLLIIANIKNRQAYFDYKVLKQRYLKTSDVSTKHSLKAELQNLEKNYSKGTFIRSKSHTIDSNENPTPFFFNLDQKKGVPRLSEILKMIMVRRQTLMEF